MLFNKQKIIILINFICLFGMASAHIYKKQSNTLKPYLYYMKILVKEAKKNPDWPFAAMIVDKENGAILCIGLNSQGNNPTYHGEIMAINNCSRKYPHLNWSKTILFTTAEPCSMCESAIIWTGISKVVYGTSIPYLEKKGWKQIDIRAKQIVYKSPFYHGSVVGGVLDDQTNKLFKLKVKQ